jgi:hypothetical protein
LPTRRSPERQQPASGAWSVASFTDHRILRSIWLRVLSRTFNGYLASPSFLLWMRYGIDVMTAMRRLQGAPARPSHSMRQP